MTHRTLTARAVLLAGASSLLLCACEAEAQVRFEDVTATQLPAAGIMSTMDIGAADLDGDGDLDLVLPQEFRTNIVRLNDGAGTFSDASDRLGTLPEAEMLEGPPQLKFEGAGHDSEDVSIADFNGDGRLDFIIVSEDDIRFGRKNVHEFYLADGAGYRRVHDVLPDTEANAVAHADITGDGKLDLLIVGAGQDRLLIGDGRGGFTDETAARLPTEAATGQDAEFADLDRDGDLDLVLGLEGGHGLWLNDGRGRFTDATADRLPAPGNVEARKVQPADVDGDGDLDLYFAHVAWQGRQGQDRLLLNDGAGRFTDATDRIAQEAGTTLDARFADLDGDGDLDLVRGDTAGVTVWINDGSGRFSDITAAALPAPIVGPNISIELADVNGDGVTDLYVGQLRGGQGGPEIRDRLLLGRRGG